MYWTFRKYGTVESVQISSNKDKHLLIQFKDERTVNEMLLKRQIVINHFKFKIQSLKETHLLVYGLMNRNFHVDPTNESNSMLQTPSINVKSSILNILNDDCLREVFEKVCKIDDFESIVKVCPRFEQIATPVFETNVKRREISVLDFKNSIKFLEFLSIFGGSVESLRLCEYDFANEFFYEPYQKTTMLDRFLPAVHRYCYNLRILYIYISNISIATINKISPLLARLTVLSISFACGTQCLSFLGLVSACYQLETFFIDGCHPGFNATIPAVHLPKLRDFQIHTIDVEFQNFLMENPQIETITIRHFENFPVLFQVQFENIRKLILLTGNMSIANEYALQIEKLNPAEIEIEMALDNSISSIFRLKNITTLQLHAGDSYREELLQSLVQILSNLKRMSIDHSYAPLNFYAIKRMLRNAKRLELFDLTCQRNNTESFVENDYDEIVEIVKKRNNGTKLSMRLFHTSSFFNIAMISYEAKLLVFDTQSEWLHVTKFLEHDRRYLVGIL